MEVSHLNLAPRLTALSVAAGIALLATGSGAHAAPRDVPGHPVISAPVFDTTVTIPVTLAWTNPDGTVPGITRFTVHFDDLMDFGHPFEFGVAATAGPGATTSTLRGVPDGLQAGHVYYFKVTACNPDGCGTPSTQSPFTVSAVVSDDSDATGAAVPTLAPPMAVAASDEAILHGTYIFDLESGHESMPGDIWWDQIDGRSRRMVPQNGAAILYLGMVDFNSIGGADLQAMDALYSAAPLVDNPAAGNQLAEGTVFAVRTRGGSYAKVLVESSGYDLRIRWSTFAAE